MGTSLLDFLGRGAGVAVGAKNAALEGKQIAAANDRVSLLDRLKQEQDAAERMRQTQMDDLQRRNIESQIKTREIVDPPKPIQRRTQVVDGQIVDMDAGTAAPIAGFQQGAGTPKPRRTQVVGGQIVDLDTGKATPIEGFVPPTPAASQGPSLTGAQIDKMNTLDEVLSLAKNTDKAMGTAVGAGRNVTGRVGGVVPVPAWARDQFKQGGEEGMSARNLLGNLVSTVGQMRSGGAISPQEFDRLEAFLPTANDDESVVTVKLRNFINTLEDIKRIRLGNYQQYGKGGTGLVESIAEDDGENVTTTTGRTFKKVTP